MKKTMSAITAAAAVTSCFTGFGAASFSAPAKAAAQTNTLSENTNQSAAELVKNLYNTAYKGKCLSRRKALPLTKAQRGCPRCVWGTGKTRRGRQSI